MRFFLTLLLVFSICFVRGQINVSSQGLNTYNKLSAGMTVLTTWSVANIVVGATQTGSDQWAFHRTNILWNTVNLGLGIAGLYSAKKIKEISDADVLLKRQRRLANTFLINVGLDVLYIAGGGLLLDNSDQVVRYTGASIMLQGGFLLLFDAVMYLMIKKERTKTLRMVPQVGVSSLSGAPKVGFLMKF